MSGDKNTSIAGNNEHIALNIKSLEQTTTSITLPKNSSVLKLKQEIQTALDVDSERQRLIFQGRVLKDDKYLSEYANLDNGKVIHLVVRPIDAPHNPLNDEPNTANNSRFGPNRTSNSRLRMFPTMSSRFPAMEGYAFITLDSSINDMRGSRRLLPSMLSGLSSIERNSNPISPSIQRSADSRSSRTSTFTSSQRTQTTSPSTVTQNSTNRMGSGLPFPPSVEARLARTLGSIRNVRSMLNGDSLSGALPTSTPEQLQQIRFNLRNNGNDQPSQISMVLGELADVMNMTVPRLREISTMLVQESAPEEENNRNRVQSMSRIVQGMSLISHFLGSVLASADIENIRRSSEIARPSPNFRLPSYFNPRENTEAIRSTPPSVITASSNVSPQRKCERSPLSSPSTTNNESSSSSIASKRNADETLEGSSSNSKRQKKAKGEKGKQKDKMD